MIDNLKGKITNILNRSKRTVAKTRIKSTRTNNKKHYEKKQLDNKREIISSKYLEIMTNKKVILFFVIIILILAIYTSYTRAKFVLDLSLQKSEYDYEESLNYWNGRRRMNIAVFGVDDKGDGNIFVDRVVVVQLNPDAPQLGLFAVNTNFVTTFSDSQSGTIKNSFVIGLREDKPLEFAVEGVENLLGINIERYMIFDNKDMDKLLSIVIAQNVQIEKDIVDEDFPTIKKGSQKLSSDNLYDYLATEVDGEDVKMKRIVDFSKNIFQSYSGINDIIFSQSDIDGIFSSTQTNISKRELFNMFLFVRRLRDDQLKIAYTRDVGAIKGGLDGSSWTPIKSSIDKDLQVIFQNPKVVAEQARVEVLNSTSTAGLASTIGRSLENQGCRIVRVGNTSEIFSENIVYTKSPDIYKETIKEIKASFGDDIKVIREEYPGRHVGDVVVVIGK